MDEFVPVVAVVVQSAWVSSVRVVTRRVSERAGKGLRDDVLRGTEDGENGFGLLDPLSGGEGGRGTSDYRAEVVLEGGSVDLEEAGKIESVVGDGYFDEGVVDVGPVEEVLGDGV